MDETYQCSAYEVPHDVHLVLRVCRSHICSLQVRTHGIVEGQLPQHILSISCALLPLLSGIARDRTVQQSICELLARRCVGIHCEMKSVLGEKEMEERIMETTLRPFVNERKARLRSRGSDSSFSIAAQDRQSETTIAREV